MASFNKNSVSFHSAPMNDPDNPAVSTHVKKKQFWKRIGTAVIILMMVGLLILVVCLLTKKMNGNKGHRLPFDEQLNSLNSFEKASNDLSVCHTNSCVEAAVEIRSKLYPWVDPCTSFYDFACGGMATSDETLIYSRQWNEDLDTLDILKAPVVTEEDSKAMVKAKKFYELCTDNATLESVGIQPITALLEKLGGWPVISPNWNSKNFNLTQVTSTLHRQFQSDVLISIGVDEDYRNNTAYAVILDESSLLLHRHVLLDQTSLYQNQIDNGVNFFVNLAKALAPPNFHGGKWTKKMEAELTKQAMDVIRFEQKLANITTPLEIKANNWYPHFYSLSEIRGFGNETILGVTGIIRDIFNWAGVPLKDEERIIEGSSKYLNNLAELLATTDAKIIANYLLFRLVADICVDTTAHLWNLHFEFDKLNSGHNVQSHRDDYCTELIKAKFPMTLGAAYVQHHFDLDLKNKTKLIVERVRAAFIDKLSKSTLSWMDSTTKENIMKKLRTMQKLVAFPDWLFNKTIVDQLENGIPLIGKSYWDNLIGMGEWKFKMSLSRIRKSPKKDLWFFEDLYPQMGSAYHLHGHNAIAFPTGHIEDGTKEDVLELFNFAGIGFVIGHEFGHGFDANGVDYDWRGSMTSWASSWSRPKFDKEIVQCFVDQYEKFEIEPKIGGKKKLKINGRLTVAENMADTFGIWNSYEAYHKWVKEVHGEKEESRLPNITQITPDQLFFLVHAQNWCQNDTWTELENTAFEETHVPYRFSIDGSLANSPDFARIWKCPAGSRMNPAPEKRCNVF